MEVESGSRCTVNDGGHPADDNEFNLVLVEYFQNLAKAWCHGLTSLSGGRRRATPVQPAADLVTGRQTS